MASARPAVHRTILVVDVEGFGNRRRTNPHQVAVRSGLYRALQQAFRNAGIPWADCRREDRGDGVFILAPSEVPKAPFVESLPHSLVEALHEHNRVHSVEERIRLRMALHAGEIHYDDHGVAGAAINLAFRLLDARRLKAMLADSLGVLAVITSSWFYDEVVRHSTASNPAAYRPMRVTVKETTTVAWAFLPNPPYPANETTLEVPSADDASLVGHKAEERAEAVSLSAGVDGRRRPWMAPPSDRIVERPDLGNQLVAALVAPGATDVGLTTGLHGVGGFGKTTLATWVCHRDEIKRCYVGGLLWVTIGHEVHSAALAERINDLASVLCGQRPAISNPEAAGAELGRLLDERESVLLVIDDVWTESQLRPFRFGGRNCTRLVTTRVPDLLPSGVLHIAVDAMSGREAGQLVAAGVDELPADMVYRLATAAGRWPVLLNLINGVLRRWVARGLAPAQAAEEILHLLAALGPTAFDPSQSADRARAVTATMEASLSLLSPADRRRYLDLAIFPEDVHIPLDVLTLLWPHCRVEAVCEDLLGIGLVADYRLDSPGPRLVVHDVIRAYLRSCRSADDLTTVHRRLVDAAKGLLPAHDESDGTPWWRLPADAGYLWRFLTHHLHEARASRELTDLVCDLRWAEAKTRQLGSVVGLDVDLALVNTTTAITLRSALRHAAHLLGPLDPLDPPTLLGATLASRIHSLPELDTVLDRYRITLARPRLEPAWPLPDLPDLTGPITSVGHAGGVNDCAFSPDGALLATTSDDQTVRLWRTSDGTQRTVLTGHTGGVWGCGFSADGSLLATASDDRTLRLWRMPHGSPQAAFVGHTGQLTACTFAPNGILVATASTDGTARLWFVADGVCQAVLTGHTGRVTDCAFSPDGALLATTGDDQTVRLWRIPDGTEQAVLTGHTGAVWACSFSPDGSFLATAGEDRTVQLWNVASDTRHAIPTGHTGRVWGCAFSPDGRLLATTGVDETVRLWHVASGTRHAVLTGHTSYMRGCTFSPDGVLLATTSGDGTARLWSVADGICRAVLTGHTTWVWGTFSPDGTLLATASSDKTVRLWQIPDGAPKAILAGHTARVGRCTFSPDGTLLATASSDKTVRLWQIPDGTCQAVLAGHLERVKSCAFSPDGTLLATTSVDQTVRLWHVASGTCQTVLTGHTNVVNACAFSPDGTLLATAGLDRTARLWALPTGTLHAVLTGHTDDVGDCKFSPDGTLLATTSDDQTVRIWQVPEGTPQAVLTGHTSWVEQCAFSPDGALIATTGFDRTVRLSHVASSRCQCALRVASPLVSISWHPSGAMLCTGGAAGIYLLNYLT